MRIRGLLSCLVALVVVVVAGCGTAGSGVSSAGPREIRIALKASGTTPQAENVQVARGTTITLHISSDHADEVHVHGYDQQYPVAAGETLTKTFTADQSGRFEIESHHPAITLVVLDVR